MDTDADYKAKTIMDLQAKLRQAEEKVSEIKGAINLLCKLDGKQPVYSDFREVSMVNMQLQGDEYHNMPQATAITEILARRKSANLAPVTIDEIYADLIAGGFQFTRGKNEAIQKRGIAIAMSKNRKFYKLPNEKWGIKTWYNIKDSNSEPKQNAQENEENPVNNVDNEQ